MKPLPETYQKDAKAFWVRMEVQPGCLTVSSTNENQYTVIARKNGELTSTRKSYTSKGTIKYSSEEVMISYWLLHHPSHYAVGDTLYLREQWRFCGNSLTYHGTSYIEYLSDDGKKSGGVKTEYEVTADEFEQSLSGYAGIWQPAATMPEWAARQRFTVMSVEAGRVSDIPNGLVAMRTISGSAYTRDEWGWCVTVEEKQ